MFTIGVIIGALAASVGIGYYSGKHNTGDPAGDTRNNPFGNWEDSQPYNP
ncbi:MAG: hypothetical protein J6W96_01215 [Alphaproteobacteria bacterium]|nr:hypothetical protein [Alphaproteobacteria bacterium]